jgi:hypothetical protein
LAPPRIKLILSRHRFASSKSNARAASSILSCNVCIVSSIPPQTHDMTEGNMRGHGGHLIRSENLLRADVNLPANLAGHSLFSVVETYRLAQALNLDCNWVSYEIAAFGLASHQSKCNRTVR